MARMILTISPEIQLAIRLRAIKRGVSTGKIVAEAMKVVFAREIREARNIIAANRQKMVGGNDETNEKQGSD